MENGLKQVSQGLVSTMLPLAGCLSVCPSPTSLWSSVHPSHPAQARHRVGARGIFGEQSKVKKGCSLGCGGERGPCRGTPRKPALWPGSRGYVCTELRGPCLWEAVGAGGRAQALEPGPIPASEKWPHLAVLQGFPLQNGDSDLLTIPLPMTHSRCSVGVC